MKRLEKGRNQRLAGKRKPKHKAAGAKPNATRQRQLAFRRKRRQNKQLKLVSAPDTAEAASSASEA